MTIVPTYTGPQCPRCAVTLTADSLRSGLIACPFCSRRFEATVFQPPQRKQAATAEVMTVGPDGANACANHARNAATASCQRCGLFICGLCDMNVGTGPYCPACFERVRTEGSLQPLARRYRDYATIARSLAIAGILISFMFLGVPCGLLATYFGVKGIKQRRKEGRSIVGVTFVVIVGILEVLAGLAWIGFLAYAFVRSPK